MKTSERLARPPTLLFAGMAALSLTVVVAKPPPSLPPCGELPPGLPG
jgi:hypothetical protein